jgi:hypothetical protein
MPMDERTKATVRALLDRYPRGYVAEVAGFTVTKTAAGLFRLLCVSALAEDSVPTAAADRPSVPPDEPFGRTVLSWSSRQDR